MEIDLFLSPSEIQTNKIKHRLAVIIDVLRASTSMITALSNGCQGIISVADIEQAKREAQKFPSESVLLGGERNEMLISGFDLSNSPFEYSSDRVKGKRIIFTSSNGSKLFNYVQNAQKTVVAGFVNVTRVSQFIIENNRDVAMLCAGKNGQFGMEDVVCGGMIIDKVKNNNLTLNDGAVAAHILYQFYANDIVQMLHQASHGTRLIEIGHEKDLVMCGQIDSIETIPILYENEIVSLNKSKNLL